ncbi:MAG: ABC transporter permease, partial [Gemmatimonadota bacterium]|nr:ABC transporter permease [Gemmatimonadota bacterium]
AQLLQDIENKRIAALVDPFGLRAVSLDTRYWSVAEKNTQLVPFFEGLVAGNRLLWLGVAALVFGLVYWRFRFAHHAPQLRRRRRAATQERHAAAAQPRLQVPAVDPDYGRRAWWMQWTSTVRREFWGIVRNVYFAALVLAGLAFVVFSATQLGKIYGTTTYPVTYQVLELLSGTFALFLLIIITFYAGELVWRERELRANQIHDALPIPTWVPFLAKLAALALVVLLVLALLMVCGVITQAAKGYFQFELTQYIKELFGIQFVDYLLLCVLALTVHTLVNHKYMGHLIVVLFFVFTGFMSQFGMEHNLYKYGSDGGVVYSDMNGYGHFLRSWSWWKLYWGAFAVLLAVATNLFWVRGQETGVDRRLRLAQARFGRTAQAIAAVAAISFVVLGGWIFYNTTILNEYRTSKQQEAAVAGYEKKYKRYEHAPQPRITAVDLHVDIFPERRDVLARGRYRLQNKTSFPVDSVHVQLPRDTEIRRLAFSRGHRQVLEDPELGYRIFALDDPLQPGDSLTLEFDLAYLNRGFENQTGGTQVVYNGTFFNNAVLPRLGYNAQQELQEDDARKKYGLKPRPRMAPVNDLRARQDSYISNDADWIDFRATVSTSADQIAIAPGYLQREWTEGGRRYFAYAMDAPILNFYSFLSARYAVKRDRWNDVAIEVYYHPGHEYNLERMIAATKKSLDYYTANFGPYQHRQVRILEFPRYAT